MNYRFRAAGKSAELYIYDAIGADWFGEGITAKRVADDLKKAGKISTLYVRINSPGGSVFDGYAIYNQLRRFDARVEVDIDGMALSIASIIALAGDEVRMAKNAMFMIHDPSGGAWGTAEDLRKTADVLDQVRGQLVDTYVGKTGLKAERISEMMTAETWFTAPEAAELGFVDRVTEDQAIAACADPSRFRNAPEWARRRMAGSATPNLDMRRVALARL